MTEAPALRKMHCPQCNAPMVWSVDNPFRPFCSERCKLIDLGQWATGAYRIPQEEIDAGQQETGESKDD
ncbi:MAG TPA: DNA gyrase inhibitor YacG [Burkholderiales bacterium]|nr:DNA gyrase inhibitor YacG [Burkholderiales bacterium]